MKFVISIKNCDSIWLKEVCEPYEKFDNYHITNGCLGGGGGDDHKYVVN
jgi:hypothetical protein